MSARWIVDEEAAAQLGIELDALLDMVERNEVVWRWSPDLHESHCDILFRNGQLATLTAAEARRITEARSRRSTEARPASGRTVVGRRDVYVGDYDMAGPWYRHIVWSDDVIERVYLREDGAETPELNEYGRLGINRAVYLALPVINQTATERQTKEARDARREEAEKRAEYNRRNVIGSIEWEEAE